MFVCLGFLFVCFILKNVQATALTHFIYDYMGSNLWLRMTTENNRCYHFMERFKCTTPLVPPVVEHWLRRGISYWVYTDH